MREILFRGKTEDGKWVEGVFIPDCLESLRRMEVHWGFIKRHWLEGEFDNVQHETVEVERETVGQFTGLLDADGEKIFEGDILRERNGEDIGFIRYDDEDGMFYLEVEDVLYNFSNVGSKWYEVIGNIHDNPELVEVAR